MCMYVCLSVMPVSLCVCAYVYVCACEGGRCVYVVVSVCVLIGT